MHQVTYIVYRKRILMVVIVMLSATNLPIGPASFGLIFALHRLNTLYSYSIPYTIPFHSLHSSSYFHSSLLWWVFSSFLQPPLLLKTLNTLSYCTTHSFDGAQTTFLLLLLTMASTISSFFTNLLSVFLLLFHLGCFIFPSSSTPSLPKRRKLTFTSSAKPHTSKSSFSRSWTYIKHLICIKSPHSKTQIQTHPTNSPTFTTTTTSAPSSIVSLTTPPPPHSILSTPSRKRRTNSLSFSETDISFDNPSFPLRNDIFPCPTCGEIFHKTHLLDHHQSVKHAVSELFDGDSGKNIVRIIFKTGWNDNVHKKTPKIHRILKIHNSPKIVSRFEEYRESVKSKASKLGSRRRDERCIADGNELLRFHCSTFMCNLGQNGNSSLCSQNYCSVCGIIRSGFSAKMDGVATMSSSWKAHVTLPDDLEDEFSFMNVKRAILICRVVAGRIGSDPEEEGGGDKEEGGFDSVFGRGGSGATQHGRLDEDELIVFNPRAVLPCFAIVYSLV